MLTVLFLVIATAFVGHCDPSEVVKADNEFSSSVYKQLASSQGGNFVYSGLSSDAVLSLLANGAKGETKYEIVWPLNLIKDDKERNAGFKKLFSELNKNTKDLKILAANKIYASDASPVLESFKNTAVGDYQAEVENLNFKNTDKAAGTINQWVEKKTNNKIQNLVDPNQLNSDTKLVLINTLYFSGNWKNPFRLSNKGSFFTSETASKEVDFMQDTFEAKYRHCGFYKVKYLQLDFQGGDISMIFVLPDSRTGLKNLEDDLKGVSATHSMQTGIVSAVIPKFRIETKIDLIPILKKLGVQKLFSNDADLSGFSSAKNLKVDTVQQKTFINVQENGVEAAAATSVGVVPTSAVKPDFTFNADHPFLFYIKDIKNEVILFAGRYQG